MAQPLGQGPVPYELTSEVPFLCEEPLSRRLAEYIPARPLIGRYCAASGPVLFRPLALAEHEHADEAGEEPGHVRHERDARRPCWP